MAEYISHDYGDRLSHHVPIQRWKIPEALPVMFDMKSSDFPGLFGVVWSCPNSWFGFSDISAATLFKLRYG